MTKEDIARKIQVMTGVGHQEIVVTLDAFMSTVKKSMREGDTIFLRGFGKFKIMNRKQKVGRNIGKGEIMIIPAKKVVRFFPSKKYFQL